MKFSGRPPREFLLKPHIYLPAFYITHSSGYHCYPSIALTWPQEPWFNLPWNIPNCPDRSNAFYNPADCSRGLRSPPWALWVRLVRTYLVLETWLWECSCYICEVWDGMALSDSQDPQLEAIHSEMAWASRRFWGTQSPYDDSLFVIRKTAESLLSITPLSCINSVTQLKFTSEGDT